MAQPMQSRVSAIAGSASQRLASLASSQEWQPKREWAAVTSKLALLTAEHDLKEQIGKVIAEEQKNFAHQLLLAL